MPKIFTQFPAIGPDPRRFKTRKHNVSGAGTAAVPREGDRLRERVARQQSRLQHLPAEQILQVSLILPTITLISTVLLNYML